MKQCKEFKDESNTVAAGIARERERERGRERLPNVGTAIVVDGIGLGSDDAFAAAGEEVGIAEFYERFMVVDVDGCEGGGGGDCEYVEEE